MSKLILIHSGLSGLIEGDLSSLTIGNSMFSGCTNLTSFSGDLSSLTIGNNMFFNCTNLTSFSSDLSSLTGGTTMFNGCTKLTSFGSDLSSLTIGNNMFFNCKLNLESVQHIANTINDLTAVNKTGSIYISMDKTLKSDDTTAPVNEALAAIRAKGWTVSENYK